MCRILWYMTKRHTYQRKYQLKQFICQLYVCQQNMEIDNKFENNCEVYNIIGSLEETLKRFSTVLFDF